MKYTGIKYRSTATWPTMALLTLVIIGFGIFAELRTGADSRETRAQDLMVLSPSQTK